MTEFAHLLSASLDVSKKDLRAIIGGINYNNKEYIAFGDRLNFIHIYNYDNETNSFNLTNSFQAHDGWIGCLTYIKPCKQYPNGALVSGSHDKSVKIWDPSTIIANNSTPTPIDSYHHDGQVCYFYSFNDDTGRIISTGWDSSCRIWDPNQEEKVSIILKHENLAIWSATPIPGGYITCGADQTIRIWTDKGEHVNTIQDAHQFPIRGCAYIDSKKTLVTIANDGNIKEWKVNGLSIEYQLTIECTDTYLYSLILLDDDTYVVSCEDHCAYFVSSKTKSLVDVAFNYDTVWCISKLNNNDVICGNANGTALVFTNNKSRSCDNETEQKYLDKLRLLQNPDIGEMNPLELADIKSLSPVDHQLGKASIVRNKERISICSWSNGYNKWLEIGGFNIDNKYLKMMNVKDENGKVWDFCITINFGDDKSLPLYMNFNDDEKKVADEFMKKNKLDPQIYSNKIIEAIRQKGGKDENGLNNSNSSILPVKSLSYYTEDVSDETFNELISINKQKLNEFVLSEEQIEILKKPISTEFFEIISKAVLKWDVDHVWPLLDILRCKIIDSQSRSFIQNQELSNVVHHLIQSVENKVSEEFIVFLIKIVINMFMNFTSLILEDDELLFDLISKISEKFDDLKPKNQTCFANLVLNYSTLCTFKPEMCVNLMEIVVDIIKPEINNVALLRLLSACGNLALFSDQAKMKLQFHPEIVLDLTSSPITNECKYVLNDIANLMKS